MVTKMDDRQTALVIAAHGSGAEGIPENRARALLGDLVKLTSFDEVVIAYHRGTPRFCEVLDEMVAQDVVVVPFMTSNGYFCTDVLPRGLARNQRHGEVRLRQTVPLGADPRLPILVSQRVRWLMDRYGVSACDATLAVVGHGTTRHAESRRATLNLATRLADQNKTMEVVACFLDDEPAVDDLLALATKTAVIVVPFLIADGPHAVSDVPARIGLDMSPIDGRPYRGNVGGRTIIYDHSVGTYSGIVEILAAMAEETL